MKAIFLLLSTLILAQFGMAQGQSAEDICPILVGSELPDVTLRNLDGDSLQLRALTDGKQTVIVVYRGGWCPYCNQQLKGLALAKAELEEMGYQLIAISPDDPTHLGETIDKKDIDYTLLSDSKMEFADGIGIGFDVDDKTLKKYKLYGIDLVKASGETHERLPVPTVLLVDAGGMVHFVYANPNYKVRLDEGLLIAAAKAMARK